MGTNTLREAAGKTAKPANRATALSKRLDSFKKQMELALPKHMNADRMSRLVLTTFSQNPKLFECNESSVLGAVITASQLGLEIGVGGQAYLIPYKETCTFVPGWQGLVDLANRSGRSSVWTGAVFDGDFFEWELGSEPTLKHRPGGENDPSKLLFAYAVGRVNGAEWPVIECWNVARLTKHRDKNNKVGRKHYSHEHWEMYCRKVVLLQVLKYLPKSIEMTAACDLANQNEHGDKSMTLDGNFVVVPNGEVVEEPAPENGTDNSKGEAIPNEPAG